MIELSDLLILSVIAIIASILSSVIFALVLRQLTFNNIEARVRSLEFKGKNENSQASKLDKQQRINLALIHAKELHDSGMSITEIGKIMAIEHPDVFFEIIAKAQKFVAKSGMNMEQLK